MLRVMFRVGVTTYTRFVRCGRVFVASDRSSRVDHALEGRLNRSEEKEVKRKLSILREVRLSYRNDLSGAISAILHFELATYSVDWNIIVKQLYKLGSEKKDVEMKLAVVKNRNSSPLLSLHRFHILPLHSSVATSTNESS